MGRQRRLRPSELARQDQYEAMAANIGRQGLAAIVTTIYAPPGSQCCWCDCPVSDHKQPGYKCGGCQRMAYYILKAFDGSPRQQNLPVCSNHYSDLCQTLASEMNSHFGPLPVDVLGIDILDEDTPRTV